jgi:flagellar protein FliJ
MDSNAALVRLKEFQIEGHRRKVAQIHAMVADFDRLTADLDREIHAEEVRSGNSDPAHFAYPTYAKAARQRRDNLRRSAAELSHQLDGLRRQLAEAVEELQAMTALAQPAPAAGLAQPRGEAGFDLTRAS